MDALHPAAPAPAARPAPATLPLPAAPGPGPAPARPPAHGRAAAAPAAGPAPVQPRTHSRTADPAPVVPVRSGRAPAPARPAVTELRLSSFKSHRGAAFALAPVTLFTGPSGSGKSHVLEAYEALARLGSGAALGEVFPDPVGCVPERAGADAQGRRGFRIGCTVDGPAGPVSLDLAVQAEPELRIVGERLTAGGQTLLTTALRDPGRRSVQAAWFTGGAIGVTRAPLPDDRLGTALLPLRVAGSTAGQRQVLEAAEQLVVALRSVFACDPQPRRMREPVPAGTGRLRGGCDNLAEVLRRTRHECGTRHAVLVEAARAGCAGPVEGLVAQALPDGRIRALLDRGTEAGNPAGTPLGRLADGELRFLALALVLLTGPGVLAVDPAAELLPARQALTVLADGLDRGLDARQSAELLRLALICGDRGHIRLVGAVGEAAAGPARGVAGVSVVDLVR
ncbi:AAA family ATPase [Streptomyces sp. NBC_00239]|uniref:AAA family ATPase n=1 Tax=Streptomyces sp. NBC_00239 TaxID=2903640 RepID=UPI002E298C13|nr:ATP-binding protein [Streptomyces sp. NBC_00239]